MFWCGQASFFLVLALYLQQGRGLRPLQAGLVFTILAAAYVAASMQRAGLALRHGRRVIVAGAVVLAAGHAICSWPPSPTIGVGGSVAVLAPGLLLVGAGNGSGAGAAGDDDPVQTLDPERAGAASGRSPRCRASATRSAWPSPA